MKKEDWSNAQKDPNNWSHLKVLSQHIEDMQQEAHNTHETIEEAALWLDKNECIARHLNMNQYLQFLKGNNIFSRKDAGKKCK